MEGNPEAFSDEHDRSWSAAADGSGHQRWSRVEIEPREPTVDLFELYVTADGERPRAHRTFRRQLVLPRARGRGSLRHQRPSSRVSLLRAGDSLTRDRYSPAPTKEGRVWRRSGGSFTFAGSSVSRSRSARARSFRSRALVSNEWRDGSSAETTKQKAEAFLASEQGPDVRGGARRAAPSPQRARQERPTAHAHRPSTARCVETLGSTLDEVVASPSFSQTRDRLRDTAAAALLVGGRRAVLAPPNHRARAAHRAARARSRKREAARLASRVGLAPRRLRRGRGHAPAREAFRRGYTSEGLAPACADTQDASVARVARRRRSDRARSRGRSVHAQAHDPIERAP